VSEDTSVEEFDTIAAWTAEVLLGMPPSYRIPGACRGSGNPAALAWLAEALEVTSATRFFDAGGGLGGPAGWLAAHYNVWPVLCDPMPNAAGWGKRLFGLPSIAASAEQLPFGDHSFDAAWVLGVLSTVDDKARFLGEVRRGLSTTGRLGLLEYVSLESELTDAQSGNEFLSAAALSELLAEHGFLVISSTDHDSLPKVPLSWQARVDHVKASVSAAHPGSPIVRTAESQDKRFADWLADGVLALHLVHVVVAG